MSNTLAQTTPRYDERLLLPASAAWAAMARLDQALGGHPLARAWLFRSRLEAARNQAKVDGHLVDSWHLAAAVAGLRLNLEPYPRIIDRGEVLDKARLALTYHQWMTEPDFDQEGEIQRAEALLAQQPTSRQPLLAAAVTMRDWIDAGGQRQPMRMAQIRYWRKRAVLRGVFPLTGAAAFQADQSWAWDSWVPAFLRALKHEAEDGLNLLYALERGWLTARQGVTGRRKTSQAARAVDLLAGAPLLSATKLAGLLGIAIKNALRILEELAAADLAIEVTHRDKRRLWGLKNLAEIRDIVRPPYRSEPGRGRGRPRLIEEEEETFEPPPLPPALSRLEFKSFDYSGLDEAMDQIDAAMRKTRLALGQIALPAPDTHDLTEA